MAFQKGVSGNLSGRPVGAKRALVAKVSKKDAAVALTFLAKTMKDENAGIDARTTAAAAVLGAAVHGVAIVHGAVAG